MKVNVIITGATGMVGEGVLFFIPMWKKFWLSTDDPVE
jgi:hypothetical protein